MDLLKNYLPPRSYQALLREKVARLKSNNPWIQLPTPYTLQSEIIHHAAKRKVVCAGRRVGKTIMAAGMAVGGSDEWGRNGILDGKRVLLSSTSQDQADVFWEYIVNWLHPLIEHGAYKNEVKRIMRYQGGEIRVKTGRHPDALRGGHCDHLILDECAYLDANAWRQVGAPMLADTEGSATFISTPNRRNWFFELYQNAIDPTNEDWAGWNFSTLKNPHLAQAALDRLTADMTEEDYEQEIMAQFLAGQGVVFRYIDECAVLQPSQPMQGHAYVFGVDWAMQKDFTVITVMDKSTRQMVALDRFNGVDWSLQRGRLKAMADRWKPIMIVAESNSVGGPNIEALQAEELPVLAFETTASSKPPLIESLVLAFDRHEIQVLDHPVLKGELMAYERKVSSTGRSQYSAPEGMHDDTVIATALAWHGVSIPPISITENVFYG